jgi:hypothetical protein
MQKENSQFRIVPSVGKDSVEDGILRSFTDPAGTKYKASSVGKAIDTFLEKEKAKLRTNEVELRQEKDVKGASVQRRRYQQYLNGLKVMGGELRVVVDRRRSAILQSVNRLDYDLKDVPPKTGALPLENVSEEILAPFSSDYESAEIKESELAYIRYTNRPPMPEGRPGSPPKSVLAAGQNPDQKFHLVYNTLVTTNGPLDGFQVVVDAIMGEILFIRCRTRKVNAQLYAYMPDPVTSSNNDAFHADTPESELNLEREEVTVQIHSASDGKYRLQGDWVHCADVQSPDFAQPEENSPVFKYGAKDRKFLSCNAYFWLVRLIQYLRTLGVEDYNNAVSSFIEIDAQAWNGADQSSFVDYTDPPQIRHGEGGVPDAADMSVIVHEYAHAIFYYLESDHGGSASYEHSVCDVIPCIFRDRFNLDGYKRTEVFPWDNNATDQWSAVRTLDRNEKFDDPNFSTYGFNLRNSMLGTAFWRCYLGMGGDSRYAHVKIAAADAIIQTLMEMLLIVPDDTSQGVEHARSMAEGCITADTALTGGLYSKVMYESFERMGLFALREVDIYIRDSSSDTGELPSPIPHWTSPDIWVRNNSPDTDGENPDDGHQPPINNVPNYLYVRVHNKGSQSAQDFSIDAYHCNPGTGMIWPDHFELMGSLDIPEPVPAGGSIRVGPFIWTPEIEDHECLLAIARGADDPSISDTLIGSVEHGKIVRFDNNVGQRNVSPALSSPGGKTKTTFVVHGTTLKSTNNLELDASAFPNDTSIEIRIPRSVHEEAESLSGLNPISTNSRYSKLKLIGGTVGGIIGFKLAARDDINVAITIDFSYSAEHLKRYGLIATQMQDGQVAGRITIEITAVKESEDYVYANPRSKELHTIYCPFWGRISPQNKVPFQTIQDGLARGFDGCAFCLLEHHTG